MIRLTKLAVLAPPFAPGQGSPPEPPAAAVRPSPRFPRVRRIGIAVARSVVRKV